MNKKIIIFIGLLVFFISFNVNAHVIDLSNDYILTYEKISNTDNCLIYCSLKFRIKLNKDYPITDNSFITKKFKNYLGNLDLIDSGFKIQSIEEYQYKDYNKPIYGEVEKYIFCNGIQGTNFGIIDINTGWCNDSLCLSNSTNCYYEHEYNTYELIGNGVVFYYMVNEIIDYNYSIGNKEVWNKFTPVGKTIKKDKWYYLELWGKRSPSLDQKSTFINISLMGKFLSGLSWWNSSYQYKRLINCNNMDDKVPIVINGSTGFSILGNNQIVWTYCSGNGTALYYNNYIDYVIANNTEQLPMEIEEGNGTNYLSSNVWDNNYKIVQHLQENPASSSPQMIDSTSNNADGNTSGSMTIEDQILSKINGGIDFDGVDDYINPSHIPNGITDFTISIWFNTVAILSGEDDNNEDYLTGVQPTSTDYLNIYHYPAGDIKCALSFGGIQMNPTTLDATTGAYNDGNWHYVFVTHNSSGNAYIYMDGIQEDSSTSSGGTLSITDTLYIAKRHSASGVRVFRGDLDEYRVSYIARSSLFMNQTYKNALGVNGFGNLEEEEDYNNPPIISNPQPTDNSTNISLYPILNITINDNDLGLVNVSFYNYSNNNAICTNNSVSNGTILHCKWNTVSKYNITYEWYVNATDNYTTTKSSIYNFTTQETTSITTTTISAEGLINIRVIDLTDSQYEEILIYQNDNTSTKYIMTKNLSKPFKVCQNVSYSFIVIPKSISIIRNVDNYFLDYLLGNIYLLAFIFTLVSIIGYLIFKK